MSRGGRPEDQRGSSGQNVLPAVHEGHWEISPQGEGSTVVYYVKYLPGGHVPDRLVRAFVGKSVRKVVVELFSYARDSELRAPNGPNPTSGREQPVPEADPDRDAPD